MYLKVKEGPQNDYLVWENILLVEAPSAPEAEARAQILAWADEGDSCGTLTYGDRPATWVFAGLRKLISVSHRGIEEDLTSGDEITYSEYRVRDLTAVQKLVAGEAVEVEYVD
jgi:hypothetical protein